MDGHRASIQPALCQLHAAGAQRLMLRLRLHALGQHAAAQLVQLRDGAGDVRVEQAPLARVAHHGDAQLGDVGPQHARRIQVGKAAAGVVQRQADALRAQAGHGLRQLQGPVQRQVLGQFEQYILALLQR